MVYFLLLLSAQLWRFTTGGHLKNKLRYWQYNGSNVTKIDPDGVIEIQKIGKVLMLNTTTNKVGYEVKRYPVPASQKWKFTSLDGNRWQKIQHLDSRLYLTARYKDSSPILTAEHEIGKSLKCSH